MMSGLFCCLQTETNAFSFGAWGLAGHVSLGSWARGLDTWALLYLYLMSRMMTTASTERGVVTTNLAKVLTNNWLWHQGNTDTVGAPIDTQELLSALILWRLTKTSLGGRCYISFSTKNSIFTQICLIFPFPLCYAFRPLISSGWCWHNDLSLWTLTSRTGSLWCLNSKGEWNFPSCDKTRLAEWSPPLPGCRGKVWTGSELESLKLAKYSQIVLIIIFIWWSFRKWAVIWVWAPKCKIGIRHSEIAHFPSLQQIGPNNKCKVERPMVEEGCAFTWNSIKGWITVYKFSRICQRLVVCSYLDSAQPMVEWWLQSMTARNTDSPDSKLLEGLNVQSPHWLIMSNHKSQFATCEEVTHLQLHLNPYKSWSAIRIDLRRKHNDIKSYIWYKENYQ